MLGLNIINIAIIIVKNVDYCCIIHDIKTICLMIVSKYKMHINITELKEKIFDG